MGDKRIGRDKVHVTASEDSSFDILFSGGTPGPYVLNKISARLKCHNFKVQSTHAEGNTFWHCSQLCPYPGGSNALLKMATCIIDEAFGIKDKVEQPA